MIGSNSQNCEKGKKMEIKSIYNFISNPHLIQHVDNIILDYGYNSFSDLNHNQLITLSEKAISFLTPDDFLEIIKDKIYDVSTSLKDIFLNFGEETSIDNFCGIFLKYLIPLLDELFEERLIKINCEIDMKNQMRKITDGETGEVTYTRV